MSHARPAQLPHSRPPLACMMRIHQEFQDARLANCTQLAELLEVSTKTIARDLEVMRDQLGLPVEYDAQIYAWRYASSRRPSTSSPAGCRTG